MARAEEPASFKSSVRRRGLDAIAEMIGERPSQRRSGRKREKKFASLDHIPVGKFPPFWRLALPDLRKKYHNLCAYLSMYIHHGTGSASVDHFIPKAKDRRLIYEWNNYRLCSGLINAYKKDREIALDPFSIEPGLFALEFTVFQVKPGPAARGPTWDVVTNTIDDLGLNQRGCCKDREEYVEAYLDGGITLARLERHAPFIVQELRRQGLLVRGDT